MFVEKGRVIHHCLCHIELVNPSFCSVWGGDLFINNFKINFAPSAWKYTENELYDVMWRHMTSRGLIFKKIREMIFWIMIITEPKFGVNWMNRKEMVNEWKRALKTALWRHNDVMMTSLGIFWLYLKFFNMFDVRIGFRQNIIIVVDFMEGGHIAPPPMLKMLRYDAGLQLSNFENVS